MVIGGQVILASVEQTQAGQFALTYPRRLGFGLGNSVVSLSWRTGDDIVVTRTDAAHPVSYVNLDGVNSDAPARGLQVPVSTIAANPSTVYVAGLEGRASVFGVRRGKWAGLVAGGGVDGARGCAGIAGLSQGLAITLAMRSRRRCHPKFPPALGRSVRALEMLGSLWSSTGSAVCHRRERRRP